MQARIWKSMLDRNRKGRRIQKGTVRFTVFPGLGSVIEAERAQLRTRKLGQRREV